MSSARIIPALKSKFVPKRRVQQAEGGGPISHVGSFNIVANTNLINNGSKLSVGDFDVAINSNLTNNGSKFCTTSILGEISTSLSSISPTKSTLGNWTLSNRADLNNRAGVAQNSRLELINGNNFNCLAQTNKVGEYRLSSTTDVQLFGSRIVASNFVFMDNTEIIVIGKKSILGDINSANTISMNLLAGLNKYGNVYQEITTHNAISSRIDHKGVLSSEADSDMVMNSESSIPGFVYGNIDFQLAFGLLMSAQVNKLSSLQSAITTHYAMAAAKSNQASLLIASQNQLDSRGLKISLGRMLSESQFDQSILGGLSLVSSINAAITTNQNFMPLRNVNGVFNLDTSVNYAGFGQVMSYGVVTIDNKSYLEMVVLVENEEQPDQAFKLVYFDLSLLDSYSSSVPLPYGLSVRIR